MLGIISGFISAACSVCSAIGGAVMAGISTFASGLAGLTVRDVIGLINAVTSLISTVAELINGKPVEELPEELGVKAKICYDEEGLKPEDFDSVEAYIKHLREDVQIPRDHSVENMSEEERRKYEMIGIGLYTQDMEQRFGVKLEPEFWRGVCRFGATAENVQTLIVSMKDSGLVHGRDIDAYLSGRLEPGSEKQMQTASVLKSLGRPLGELQDAYRQEVDR